VRILIDRRIHARERTLLLTAPHRRQSQSYCLQGVITAFAARRS
jgi:hypothetical protein